MRLPADSVFWTKQEPAQPYGPLGIEAAFCSLEHANLRLRKAIGHRKHSMDALFPQTPVLVQVYMPEMLKRFIKNDPEWPDPICSQL